jgi:uncharacterized protein (TIGR00251 family)
MPLRIDTTADGVTLAVKVVPGSSRDAVVGLLGDALKVKVARPPEHGQANRAVEALLARTLGLAPRAVTVIAGQAQPQKRVHIAGVTAQQVLDAFT